MPPGKRSFKHHDSDDDFVGRAPWPAADPLVGLLEHRKGRTRGSGADGGVRPTFGCGHAAWWGRRCRLPSPASREAGPGELRSAAGCATIFAKSWTRLK